MLSTFPNGHCFNFTQLGAQIPARQMILSNLMLLPCQIHPEKGTATGIPSTSMQALTDLGAPGVSRFNERTHEKHCGALILQRSGFILLTSTTRHLKCMV